ncbi:hypothetical protein BH09ACT5_BH09ACT5_14250 [soil metagenome]
MIAERLAAVATAWAVEGDAALDSLIERARLSARTDDAWLLLVALTGAYPTTTELISFQRRIAVRESAEELRRRHPEADDAPPSLRVVRGVLVDASITTADTGTIEGRLLQEAVPRWLAARPDIERASWSAGASSLRSPEGELVVPWRATLVVPVIPDPAVIPRYSCAAEFSGSDVRIVGHDLVSGVSGALIGDEESERIARYISVAKHASRVVAADSTVAAQFTGLGHALVAQGLPAPKVVAVDLPADLPITPAPERPGSSRRTVLCTVDVAPGENRDAVLFAAEQLHAEGLAFRLVVASSEPLTLRRRIAGVLRRGQVVYEFGVDDRRRAALESRSLFSVFVPTVQSPVAPWRHPVVRSLSAGRPVVTSDRSRTASLARSGGCLTVDPHDDDAIIGAMRSLLTDDEALESLAASISLPARSWHEYAELSLAALLEGAG